MTGVEMGQSIKRARASGSAFATFSKLPTELQIMIWELAATDIPARTVTVNIKFWTKRTGKTIYRSRTRAPALLQTCGTARRVARKLFDASIESNGRTIWLNGEKDLLILYCSKWIWEQDASGWFDSFNTFLHNSLGQEDPTTDILVALLSSTRQHVFKGIRRLAIHGKGGWLAGFHSYPRWKNFCDKNLPDAFPDLEEYISVLESDSKYKRTLKLLQDPGVKLQLTTRTRWYTPDWLAGVAPRGEGDGVKIKYIEGALATKEIWEADEMMQMRGGFEWA